MNNDNNYISIIANAYLYLKKYFIIFIVFITVGILFGIFRYHSIINIFKKHIIFNSGIISNYITTDLINSLQLYINEDVNTLAKKMNINVEAANNIVNIESGSYDKQNNGFWVDLYINSNKYSDTITRGLLYYINNNKFYKEVAHIVNKPITQIQINDTTYFFPQLNFRKTLNEYMLYNVVFKPQVNIVEEFTVTLNKQTKLLLILIKQILIYSIGMFIIALIITFIIDSYHKVKLFIKKEVNLL